MVLLLSLTAPTAGYSDVVQPAVTLPNPSSIRKRQDFKSTTPADPTCPRLRHPGGTRDYENQNITARYDPFVLILSCLTLFVVPIESGVMFCNFVRRFLPRRAPIDRASPPQGLPAGGMEGWLARRGGAHRAAAAGAGPQARLRSSRSVWGTGMEPMPSATISRHSRFCGMIGGTGIVLGSAVASAMGFSSALPVTSPRRKKPL